MKFAQNIHPTRLFGPTLLWNLLKNIHPTRLFGPTCLIGIWEYAYIFKGHLFRNFFLLTYISSKKRTKTSRIVVKMN